MSAKSTHTGWKVVAALEVVGGVLGLAFIAAELARRRVPPAGLVAAAVLTALYLFALAAGVLLWRGARGGWAASVAVQLVQLPKLVAGGVALMVSFGLDVVVLAVIGSDRFSLGVKAWAGANHQLTADPRVGVVGVSLMSFVALWLLGRAGRGADRPDGVEDAAAAFRASSEAVRMAKEAAAGPPEHPAWVPSAGFCMVVVAALVVLACCGGFLLLPAFLTPSGAGR